MIWQVILMAVLQGLTEFLPVSSSGHLALLGSIFGFSGESNLTLTIVLHIGSLGAIFFFYFKTLWGLLKRENHRIIGLILIGTVPAAVVGIAIKKSEALESFMENLTVVGICFIITATLLVVSEKFFARKSLVPPAELKEMTVGQAVIIGLFQMLALPPGISRSGSTIAAGIMNNIERKSAAAFSFMLAIPAIAGGGLLELIKYLKMAPDIRQANALPLPVMAIGLVVSAVVSFFALSLLVKLLKKGSWLVFSYYLYILGAGTIIYSLVR